MNQKEIQKVIKDKHQVKISQNNEQRKLEEIARCCNYLGHLYAQQDDHDKAFAEHEEELECLRKNADNLGVAVAYRKMGECCAAMEQFDRALKFHQKYYEMARKENSIVEMQRAWATLGRTYYLEYSSEPERKRESLNTAEEAQLQALKLADKLLNGKECKERDCAEMRCRACLNLGIIYELKDDEKECQKYFKEAINIAKRHNFTEDLNRCETCLATFFLRIGCYTDALNMYKEAFLSAKALKNKSLMYETLMNKGQTLLLLKDYESARHCFKKAHVKYGLYCQSSMNEELTAQKALIKTKQIIANVQQLQFESDVDKKMAICDRLGDLFVDLACFSTAIEYYGQQLELAKQKGADASVLCVIHHSLGQTYADNRQYIQALEHFQQELECYRGDLINEIPVQLKIVDMYIQMERNSDSIVSEFEQVLINCGSNAKLKYRVYEDLAQYLNDSQDRKEFYVEHLEAVEKNLKKLRNKIGSDLDDDDDDDDDGDKKKRKKEREEEEEDKDEQMIGEQESDADDETSDLTSDSDEEDGEEVGNTNSRRKRRKKLVDKPQNDKGETPLHLACIKNDIKTVKKLLEKGHRVNIRDFSGWMPLHEACNYGHVELVQILLDHKASINDTGTGICAGTTPLHDACHNGNLGVIRVLMKNGANLVALDHMNHTPLDILKGHCKDRWEEFDEITRQDYGLMIEEMENEMKKKGYDVKRFRTSGVAQKRSISLVDGGDDDDDANKSNSDGPPRKTSCNDNMIGTLNMRRNADPSGDNFRSRRTRKPEVKGAFIDENELVENWLDDDLGDLPETKQTYVDLYEMKRVVDRPSKSCKKVTKKKPRRRKDDDNEEDEEDDFYAQDTFTLSTGKGHHRKRSSPKKKTNDANFDYDILLDDDDDDDDDGGCGGNENDDLFTDTIVVNESCAGSAFSGSQFKNTSKQPEVLALPETVKPVALETTTQSDHASSIGSSKIKFRVHIDQMLLLIPVIQKNSTVATLEKEVMDRYEKMKKIRPNISIFTMDGALLSSDDLLEDVLIQNEVKAEIESYEIKPLNEVYRQECVQNQLEPINELEFEFRMAMNCGSLNMRNVNLPKAHHSIVIQSIVMQNQIRVLDLSYSNWLQLDSVAMKLFPSLVTLKCLQTLNLECTGLTCGQIKQLSTLSMVNLMELNLNYNWLCGLTDCLVQLIKNQPKLQRLSLQFCDLTQQLVSSLPFNQILENRENLHIQIDPFVNQISISSKMTILDMRSLPEVCETLYQDFQRCLACK